MKTLSIILFAMFFSKQLLATERKTFSVKSSIIIDRPIKDVYLFAGNTSNDATWRSEVHIIHANGGFEVGTRYVEDARLGIHNHYMTEVELKRLNPPISAIYETVLSNPFYLKSFRLFEEVSESQTRFTYKVIIENEMIGDITGLQLPIYIIRPTYEATMRKYMRRLKSIMENDRILKKLYKIKIHPSLSKMD